MLPPPPSSLYPIQNFIHQSFFVFFDMVDRTLFPSDWSVLFLLMNRCVCGTGSAASYVAHMKTAAEHITNANVHTYHLPTYDRWCVSTLM